VAIGERVGAFGRNQVAGPELLGRCVVRAAGVGATHVLWFDECYDEELYRYESSREAAERCTVLVSVGTSGNTNLPLQNGNLAVRGGARLIDVNLEENPFSRLAQSSGGTWLQMGASQGNTA